MQVLKLYRWAEELPPSETALREQFAREGLTPYRWSNGPGDRYAAHQHPYFKVVFVVRGAITFGVPERGEEMLLQAGDRLDLPAGTLHDAVVGPQGVVCLEGHRYE